MSAKQEIRKLEKQEDELIEALAVSVAKLERLDDDVSGDKRRRDRMKKRKESGRPYDEAILKKLNDEIRKVNEELAVVRKRKRKRQGWLRRTRITLKRKRRRLRNSLRPKIIDLKLDFRPMTLQTSVDKVIGHYTAGPVDEDTADAIRLSRQYHEAHLAQGWSGEAYMVNFTRDGDILLLRPSKWVGAHTLGYNTGSYGIMCHGTTGDRPSKAQKRTMRWWAKHGHEGRMGPAQTRLRPSSYPWKVHRDFTPTACPGSFEGTYRSKGQ